MWGDKLKKAGDQCKALQRKGQDVRGSQDPRCWCAWQWGLWQPLGQVGQGSVHWHFGWALLYSRHQTLFLPNLLDSVTVHLGICFREWRHILCPAPTAGTCRGQSSKSTELEMGDPDKRIYPQGIWATSVPATLSWAQLSRFIFSPRKHEDHRRLLAEVTLVTWVWWTVQSPSEWKPLTHSQLPVTKELFCFCSTD